MRSWKKDSTFKAREKKEKKKKKEMVVQIAKIAIVANKFTCHSEAEEDEEEMLPCQTRRWWLNNIYLCIRKNFKNNFLAFDLCSFKVLITNSLVIAMVTKRKLAISYK